MVGVPDVRTFSKKKKRREIKPTGCQRSQPSSECREKPESVTNDSKKNRRDRREVRERAEPTQKRLHFFFFFAHVG